MPFTLLTPRLSKPLHAKTLFLRSVCQSVQWLRCACVRGWGAVLWLGGGALGGGHADVCVMKVYHIPSHRMSSPSHVASYPHFLGLLL